MRRSLDWIGRTNDATQLPQPHDWVTSCRGHGVALF
jgi:hypothetical protein